MLDKRCYREERYPGGAGSGGCWCDTTYRGSVLSVFECGTVYPRSVFVVRDECSIKPSCRDGREDAE